MEAETAVIPPSISTTAHRRLTGAAKPPVGTKTASRPVGDREAQDFPPQPQGRLRSYCSVSNRLATPTNQRQAAKDQQAHRGRLGDQEQRVPLVVVADGLVDILARGALET